MGDYHDYILAIGTDENDHCDRNIDYEIKKHKAMEKGFGCGYKTIDLDKK